MHSKHERNPILTGSQAKWLRFSLAAIPLTIASGIAFFNMRRSGVEIKPLMDPPAISANQRVQGQISFGYQDSQELSPFILSELKNFSVEFSRLFNETTSSTLEKALISERGLNLCFVNFQSGKVPREDFCAIGENINGKQTIYINWQRLPIKPDVAGTVHETSAIILQKISMGAIAYKAQQDFNVNASPIPVCRELVYASSERANLIAQEMRLNHPEAQGDYDYRMQLLEHYSPLQRTLELHDSAQYDYPSYLPGDQRYSDFESAAEVICSMRSDNSSELGYTREALERVQGVLRDPQKRDQVRNMLTQIGGEARKQFAVDTMRLLARSISIIGGSDESKKEIYRFICSRRDRFGRQFGSGNFKLREELHIAGNVAAVLYANELDGSGVQSEKSSDALNMVVRILLDGGELGTADKSKVARYLERAVLDHERDETWSTWQIPERYSLEALYLSDIGRAAYLVLPKNEAPAFIGRVEKLFDRLHGGLRGLSKLLDQEKRRLDALEEIEKYRKIA